MDASPNPFEARYDDAMFDFTTEQFDSAITKLEAILAEDLRLHKNKHPNNALIKNWLNDERVILTPHNAFNTIEATERKSRLTVSAWQNFLKKGTFPRKVV